MNYKENNHPRVGGDPFLHSRVGGDSFLHSPAGGDSMQMNYEFPHVPGGMILDLNTETISQPAPRIPKLLN